LRPLDAEVAQPLLGTDGAVSPFWSPDSRSIAFFAGQKLKRLELPGGTPRTLADAPSNRGGTWGRDGTILFVATNASPVVRVSANGGRPVEAVHLATSQDVAMAQTPR
jgi:hypothetical protein